MEGFGPMGSRRPRVLKSLMGHSGEQLKFQLMRPQPGTRTRGHLCVFVLHSGKKNLAHFCPTYHLNEAEFKSNGLSYLVKEI